MAYEVDTYNHSKQLHIRLQLNQHNLDFRICKTQDSDH